MKESIKDLIIFAILLGVAIWVGWMIAYQLEHFIWNYLS